MPKFEKRVQGVSDVLKNIRGYTDGGGSALVNIHRSPEGAGMLNVKCIAILDMYRQNLELYGESGQFDGQKMKHLQSMVHKASAFFQEGRREKGFRWLGFIQGALWSEGIYSLEELKEHNRPDPGNEKDEEEE